MPLQALIPPTCPASSLRFSSCFPSQLQPVLDPWRSGPQHVDWGKITVDPVTHKHLEKRECKHNYLWQHVCVWTGSYAQATAIPSKLFPHTFLAQSINSGYLHWCFCGSCHKHHQHLYHILVSVCIVQPTQDVQVYKRKGWHRHKGSEVPCSQYGTYTGPPKCK